MALTVEGTCDTVELNVKRLYLPGLKLKSKCPNCNAPYERDLGDHHLSYPVVGVPEDLTGYCGGCEHEWALGSVVLRLSLEVTPADDQHPKEGVE